MNLKNIQVSLFKKYNSPIPCGEISLYDWLTDETLKNEVEYLRTIIDKKDRNRIKATLPGITPSGVFATRKSNALKEHSGIICIDIDGKDNPHILDYNDLKFKLSKLKNISYCGLSVSGLGLFCLIPIKFPEKHKQHFESLKRAFKELKIEIDKGCGDVSRLRGYSYDPNPHFNLNAIAFEHYLNADVSIVNKTVYSKTIKRNTVNHPETDTKVLSALAKIDKMGIDITGDYNQWFRIGCSLANTFGEDGRELFHRVSQYSEQYTKSRTDREFNKCLNTNYEIDIGTFFHWVKFHDLQY